MNKNHYIPITICKSRNKNVVTGELELIVAKPWSSFRRLDQGKKKKKKAWPSNAENGDKNI